MKKILIAFLLLCNYATEAQRYDKNHHFYVDEADNKEPEYASSEIGISTGIAAFQSATLATRLQFTARFARYFQASFMLNYIGTDDGIGGSSLAINFPLDDDASYFYPGVQVSYFFDYGFSYGFHLGYTARLSKLISLNVEPEILFLGEDGQTVAKPILLQAGIRFNL